MVTYECVWYQSDNGPWLCIFALDIYDWKDLGRTGLFPACGCAGCYVLPSRIVPTTATKGTTSRIIIPMTDPLDPFSRWDCHAVGPMRTPVTSSSVGVEFSVTETNG